MSAAGSQLALAKPVALVTGASRRIGIGAAICRRLAQNGFDIAFTHWQPYDRSTDHGEDPDGPGLLQSELLAGGAMVIAMEADLSDPASPVRVMKEAATLPGRITVLVNNAAHSTRTNIENLTAADMDAHYAVNVRGMALLCGEFLRQWQGGPGGRIINLTSGQSLGAMPGELAYVASKGAVEAFTVSLAAAASGRGITVNAVNPGPTDTGWMTNELKAERLSKFPMGRIGMPDDVARLVAFLASEEAQWITGQVINSEGGFLR